MNTAELLNARRDTSRTEREQVLEAMKKAGHGSTILELEFVTGIRSSTVIARLHELIDDDKVVIAPFRRRCMVNDITKKVSN